LIKRIITIWSLVVMIISVSCTTAGCNKPKTISGLTLAVEYKYNTHAACAYVAQNKGWLPEKDHGKGGLGNARLGGYEQYCPCGH